MTSRDPAADESAANRRVSGRADAIDPAFDTAEASDRDRTRSSTVESRSNDPGGGFQKRWAVVWIAELLLLGWYMMVPLPNAGAVAGKGVALRRGMIVNDAIPGLAMGNRTIVGLAIDDLSHVQNLPQRIPIFSTACSIAAVAIAIGSALLAFLGLDRRLGRVVSVATGFGLGMSVLGVLTLISGRLGLLSVRSVRIGLAAAFVVATLVLFMIKSFQKKNEPDTSDDLNKYNGNDLEGGFGRFLSRIPFGIVIALFLTLMALGSTLPTIEYDALSYHLQGPKEYYLAGRIRFLPHNVYTNMPFQVEMGHLLSMYALGDWWRGALAGQAIVMLYAPATAILIYSTVRALGSPRGAWFASIVYLSTPWIYRLGVLPYVEGPLCFYHAALVRTALLAWNERSSPFARVKAWFLVGLLAGGAFGCKYPALISAVVPFAVVAVIAFWKHKPRSIRPFLAYCVGVLLIASPWLIKNVIDTGNPVYPLGWRVFGGPNWDEARERQWVNAHGPKPIAIGPLVDALLDISGRSDWQSCLYVAFAPLAFLKPGSKRISLILSTYVCYLFATWWLLTHRLDRFWLPLLPVAAMLSGLGADWTTDRRWTMLRGFLITMVIATNLIYSSTALTAPNEWTANLDEIRGRTQMRLNTPLYRLDRELPPGSKPLVVGQASVFHLRRPIVYNTVFNPETIESIVKGKSRDEILKRLKELGITHIYVDWNEISRFRSEGNYGFSPFVQPEVFDRLVSEGVLKKLDPLGAQQDLYVVTGEPRNN